MKISTGHLLSVGKVAALATAIAFAVASTGWAQSRAGGVGVHAAGHVGGARPMPRPAGRIATPLNPNFAPIRGVPGNGFDYEHLVAVAGSTGRRSGMQIRDRRSFITPIFGVGLPYYYAFDSGYPYDSGVPNEQSAETPLVPAIPDSGQAVYAGPEIPAAPVAAPLPPPDLGQLILVRRDGQVVMAVGFTTSGGQLTYITKDGLRRSFPISELDTDATREMNGVNGTSVAIRN